MANQDELVGLLRSIGMQMAPTVSIIVGIFLFIKLVQTFKVHSKGNEWLLVIRSGELRVAGVGISAWKLPSDQAVRFPSHI